ncbi:hypothetical protein JANAI62_06990 [Jannaschia pagri]|uniref:Lipoprotein n=1 Tax=Jannaschia pagri TaxID=2829797 RepID=A0ABQ4NI32_9RHOB|nr:MULTISPECIES: hypothetical protein [unclassified Jannaschia]GIT89817.1 hypothetical protein JANAI61_02750 [Jannaschia sp. AI_61]GIT94076.1 hypothetical protein JANAI62_06990 [Jannaschia sp. AI_62]
MRVFGLIALCLVLVACNAPHPLAGLTRSGFAEAGGHRFRVNWSLSEAQATRTNAVWRPGLAEVRIAAVAATAQVTGCDVIPGSAIGDVALVSMRLSC